MLHRTLLITLFVLLLPSVSLAVDEFPLLQKWLLKSKRSDLKSYSVISNAKYSTHLFIATDGAKVKIERDDETGLSSFSINGKCQLFFYRTISRYVSGGYYSEHAWSITDPLDVKEIFYSPEKHEIIVSDQSGSPIKNASIKVGFRSLFYCPCKSVQFQPEFGDEKSWPMPTQTDGNPSDQLALDDLVLRARKNGLKHFHVIVAKDKKAALVIATEAETISLETDEDGIAELKLEAKAAGVLLHSRWVCQTIPRYISTGTVLVHRFRINGDADGVDIEFTTKDKRQTQSSSDHWMSVLLGKPDVRIVKPVVGNFKEWKLPDIIGN